MKKLVLLSLLFVSAMVSSCKKDEVANPEMAVTSTLSGANEVPAVTTTATGAVTGTYNKTTKMLSLMITYSGMTPTAWHIHKGAAGMAGGVIFNIGTDFKSPFTYMVPAALTTDQETDLMAGTYYVNIHSAKAAGGEIRGNLTVK